MKKFQQPPGNFQQNQKGSMVKSQEMILMCQRQPQAAIYSQ